MAGQYKLLVGIHQGRDAGAKKDPETGLYPLRTYKAGQTVVSEQDLVYLFGREKFERLGGDGGETPVAPGEPSEHMRNVSPAVAPHGQVITGHQQTSGGVPGPVDPARARQLGVAGAGTPEAATAASTPAGSPRTPPSRQQQQDFTAAPSDTPPPDAPSDADLEGMTVQELRDYAQEEEINLHGATTKADIVKAIRKGK